MMRLEVVKYNIILTKKQQKYQHYNLEKLIKSYLTDQEILPSGQSRFIEQATFTHPPLEEAFKNQRKILEEQGAKQVEALKALKPEENQELKSIEGLFLENMKCDEIKIETYVIRKWEKIKQNNLKYKTYKYLFDFQKFKTINFFGDSIYTSKINIDKTEMDLTNLLQSMIKFINKS